jgi:hypothetical protein
MSTRVLCFCFFEVLSPPCADCAAPVGAGAFGGPRVPMLRLRRCVGSLLSVAVCVAVSLGRWRSWLPQRCPHGTNASPVLTPACRVLKTAVSTPSLGVTAGTRCQTDSFGAGQCEVSCPSGIQRTCDAHLASCLFVVFDWGPQGKYEPSVSTTTTAATTTCSRRRRSSSGRCGSCGQRSTHTLVS